MKKQSNMTAKEFDRRFDEGEQEEQSRATLAAARS